MEENMNRPQFSWSVKITAFIMIAGSMSAFSTCSRNNAASETTSNEVTMQSQVLTADPNRKVTVPGGSERYPKIVAGISVDPYDLSPVDGNRDNRPNFYWSIYECLFDLVNNEYIPALAKSWTAVDPLHWNVEIQDFIKDTGGNHITADDVVNSYKWTIATGKTRLDILKDIEKVGEYTVQFIWNWEPTKVGELENSWCRVFIVAQKAMGFDNMATKPIGTGPYKVNEYTTGSKIVLEAKDNYWASGTEVFGKLTPAHHANVQIIEYHVIGESAQHTIAMETGVIDYSEAVSPTSLYMFQEGGRYAEKYGCLTFISNMYHDFMVNCFTGVVTDDINLRLAMYYAINNEIIPRGISNMTEAKAFGSPYFSDYVQSWETKPTYINTYDLNKAKDYLSKSNYKGEKLRLVCETSEEARNLGTLVQAMIAQVGINCEILAMDSAIRMVVEKEPKDWDIMVHGRGGPSLIGAWNSALKQTTSGNTAGLNNLFVKDDELEKLYDTAREIAHHNDQTMTALFDYALDKAYGYTLVLVTSSVVYNRNIAEIYRREGYATMGGSIFYLD
jgi:ABC-type transport system substrate-binding protein